MFKKISKSISVTFVALLFGFFLAGNTKIFADTTQTGQWGGATWTLSNNTVTLSGGNIGTPASDLKDTLSNAGVDTSTITTLDFSDQTNGSNVIEAFGNLPNLTTISNLNNLTWYGSAYCFFMGDNSLVNLSLSGFNTSNISNMSYMFGGLTKIKTLDLSGFDTHNVNNMYGMFDADYDATSINVSSFDTSNVQFMDYMFCGDSALTSLNILNFNTSNVTSMAGMFDGDVTLTSINLSNFNTSNVTEMSYLFMNEPSLKSLDLSKFNTDNLQSMVGMFDADSALTTLDLSNFNTSNVWNMEYAFYGDSSLTNVNLSSFNTGNVTNMEGMFDGASSLKVLNLSNFDTSNVTDMTYIFAGAGVNQLTLGAKTDLNKNNALYLSNVPTTNGYTGNWQNVGTGTVTDPNGSNVWASDQFAANYTGGAQADTYVWQPARTMSLGTTSTFENDILYGWSGATKPLHPYRYYTVLNNNYPYYLSLTQGQDASQNIVSLGDKTGATVYEQKTMPVTYTSGPEQGQTQTFAYISFDGNTWYWVDARALNSDIEYGSINLFNGGVNSNTGEKDLYQMVANSFNQNGQIVYQSEVTQSDFSSLSDPAAAMATYNANLDAAAQRWNQALGQTVFVKADGSQPVTLKISAGSPNQDVYLNGQAYVDPGLTTYGNNVQADNPLLETFTHEMGHALGLNHTGGGSYYNDPYTFSDDTDVMWAVYTYDPTSGYLYGGQQNITQNDVNAVKLIIQNQNFENPQP